jgi:hypothetical protein
MLRAAAVPIAVVVCACGASHPADGAPGSGPLGTLSPQPACTLSQAGQPIPIVGFADRHATAPSMLLLDSGSGDESASIAIQVFASAGDSGLPDDIEVARARVGPNWPDDVALDQPPQLMGEFALGPGYLARSLDAPPTLALAWHRDNALVGRPQLRLMDVARWEAGADVEVAPSGDAIYSFVAGGAVGAGGSWEGQGYAVAWRDVGAPGAGPARPFGALLDADGDLVRGPSPLASGENYPGRAPSIAWTGSGYLVATAYDDCVDGSMCAPRSVVVATMVASAEPWGGISLRPVTALPATDEGSVPGTASIAWFGGIAWVAWTEGPAADAGGAAARTVRLAALDGQGRLLGAPIVVAADSHPRTRVALSAGDAGVLVTWAEDAPGSGAAPNASDVLPGASFVVVQRVGLDGTVDSAPLRIPATRIDDYAPPTASAIASPRGALVLWAGRSTDPASFDVTYLARVDCGVAGVAR